MNAQSELIRLLTDNYGGYTALATLLDNRLGGREFHRQNIINWRIREGVPMRQAFIIAPILEVNPAVLNYKVFKESFPNIESWRSLVKSVAQLSPQQKNYILGLKL